ncbi:ribbon-helix-helix protein, CopG family [Mycolicibacterium sp. OfavD-34-C]|uniref:type II toxin-antitoxin system VapB family antitoxin n=1 Tax=Mycolicibacterium sp. OfavD-34-C TaxID=2917746 RepID=UPI001EF688A8|nr:ribbon-helix-helix protein, CopG family [Mycolicibacterium sp. OfavD-34-C]MCG7581645.1 ribbon-helix-helix protein, CopG family [Mycolicibacterium sp. OfavD-34-C]
MSDLLIRDVPENVLAGLDARAAELGLSRVEFIRRRLAQEARAASAPVTQSDLSRFGTTFSGLAEEDLMRQAWE